MTATPLCDLDRMRFEFFAWASARAAQAGSSKTTVPVLRGALVNADAANWHRTIAVTSAKGYDAWHMETIDGVHRKLVSTVPAIGWGIAAKLVNVFIKGRWLLDPGYVGPMRAFGHPAAWVRPYMGQPRLALTSLIGTGAPCGRAAHTCNA